MATEKTNLRICSNGHRYYKTSDCPTCPACEREKKPSEGFLSLLGAPARRALINNGITTLQQLSQYTEKEVLALHGMGPGSIPRLKDALHAEGLSFKNK